eukprot:TRINITY_DN9810_c0_g1_i2.p1 TRINITY_DN9810_c0_g1~~TRINITY_DN9810_c0_g1_i2.p1  ORF type:complete len:169 (+),score=18.17 TRINITY_DN9810_c0_g1_i2:64-570(+)
MCIRDRMNTLRFIERILRAYYITIFLFGNVYYFDTSSDCREVTPDLARVVLIFLILGYLYIGFPIVFFLLVCFCLPILLGVWIWILRRRKNRETEFLLRRLRETTFEPPANSENASDECTICLLPFNRGEKIVTLPCAGSHFFHTECIKKWVVISHTCPICRGPIVPQ